MYSVNGKDCGASGEVNKYIDNTCAGTFFACRVAKKIRWRD